MNSREKLSRLEFVGSLVGGALPAAGVAPTAQSPSAGALLTGSFFDLIHPNSWDATYWTDACRFWREENWRALMRDMHAIGMDTAILTTTANWGRPLFPGYEKTVGIQVRMGCPDPLGVCVEEANRLNMKMFFGVGLRGRVSQVRDYSDMRPPWPDVWFRWNTALAQALVDRYGQQPCFGGLYLSYEIDFVDYQVDLYEKLIKQYLRPAVGAVKLLASPGSLGDHPKLDQLPRQLERTGINILAPQDYGGRSRDAGKALALVRRNAAALEKVYRPLKEAGVTLWANVELFELESNPSGRGVCVGGPFDRIREQIRLQAPLVDKLICYQYQGVMNRRTRLVDIGHPSADQLHSRYRDYLNQQFPGRYKL